MTLTAIDLFAGPGGWDVAAHALGIEPLGIEWDDAACQTRAAAGLRTLQGDVGDLDPVTVMREHVAPRIAMRTGNFTAISRDADGARSAAGSIPYERRVSEPTPTIRAAGAGEWLTVADVPLDLLIASPPCQAFSMAGSCEGRRALTAYEDAINAWRHGTEPDVAALDERCGDPRAHLVLEPLRWAFALNPRMIACEQVPPVLPLWEAMAGALQDRGYQTWTGILSAEQYGVPQTRQRAILLASLDGPVTPPPPTHARYVAPRKKDEQTMGLFDAPEPDRIVAPEDRHLEPWVSMAEALGWGMTARPYLAIASSRSTGGPDKEKVGGSAARQAIYNEQASGRWRLQAGTGKHEAERGQDHPAPTLRFGERLNAATRAAKEPAPTIIGGHDWANQWRLRNWTGDRPATTVNGDPRISEPGHHDSNTPGSQMANAVRVSLPEALVLQSFPADYPVAGSKSKQFQQVGNAIPPLLAHAILKHLTTGCVAAGTGGRRAA